MELESKKVTTLALETLDNDCLLENLQAKRDLKGYSIPQLAKIMGVTAKSIYDLENGYHDPKLSLLKKYAKAVDCHLEIEIVNGPLE